jgi:GDPmannose 4,6-dehydratase
MARRILGWRPRVSFRELIQMMMAHDIELARRERTVKQAGFAEAAPGSALTGGD